MAVSGQEDWMNLPELDVVDVTGQRGGGAFWNWGVDILQPFNNPFEGITQPEDVSIPYWDSPPPADLGPPVRVPQNPLQRCYFESDGSDQALRNCDIQDQINEAPPVMALVPPPKVVVPPGYVTSPNPFPQPRGVGWVDSTKYMPSPQAPGPPKIPSLPETLVTGARSLTFSLLGGLAALLFPQPMGPRRFDEVADRPDTELVPLVAPRKPKRSPRSPAMPLIEIPREVLPELPMITVTPERRARPQPQPRIIEVPLGTPNYFTDPFGFPVGDPRVVGDPRTRPVPTDAPERLTDPLNPFAPDTRFEPQIPDFLTAPRIGDPFESPPRNRPTTPDPYRAPDLMPIPGPEIFPFPIDPFGPSSPPRTTTADPCNCKPCSDSKPKKKKKKESKSREVCYRGTYRQMKKGITYKKLEQVPCESPSKKRSSKPRVDTLKDLAGSIFGNQSFNVGS